MTYYRIWYLSHIEFPMFFEQTLTHDVRHIEIADDVIYTPEQLTSLIRSVAPSAGMDTLTVQCPPEGVTGSATYTHKVKEMVIKWCAVNMADITSLIRHLDVGHIYMRNVNLKVNMAEITSLTRHLDVEHMEMDDVTLRVDGEVSTVIYRLF